VVLLQNQHGNRNIADYLADEKFHFWNLFPIISSGDIKKLN